MADLRDEEFDEMEDLNHMERSDSAHDQEALQLLHSVLCVADSACALSGLSLEVIQLSCGRCHEVAV